MDALQFAYWLNGFAELHSEPPTPAQWASIKEHLGLVFKKVTPIVTPPFQADPIDPSKVGWPLPKSPTCAIQATPPSRAVC